MDKFTKLFWLFSVLYIVSSIYLLSYKKIDEIKCSIYIHIIFGFGIFATSKIGRTFLGLE
jgi:hypothetical protein